MTGFLLRAEVSTLKESCGICSFMVIPWWCPHPNPTFLGCPLQHQQFPLLPWSTLTRSCRSPMGSPSSWVPVQLVQSCPALGRVAEVKTKAAQPGAGHQPLSLLGHELGLQEAEEGRRG